MGGDRQSIPLQDLVEPDSPITYGVVQPGPIDPGGVRFIRGGDVFDGRILEDQLRTIGRTVSEQYGRTLLRGGELLVSLVGNPGAVALVPQGLAGANIARQVGLVRLRQDVDARYVMYFLASREGKAALGAQTMGSVQQVINLRDLRNVSVPLPPEAEQRAIAEILGALDEKIDLNRRTNETLDAMARALFKSWFVDFDPVRSKAQGRALAGMDAATAKLFPDRLAPSELGEVPRGWEHKPLYDCASWVNGAAYRDFQFCDPGEGLPIIKIAELKAGIAGQTRFTLTNPGDKYLIDTGDVLFSWSGNPDTSIDTFVWSRGKGWLNQHIFKVITNSGPERTFVLWLLRYLRPAFAEIARNKQTTGLGHVTAGDMKRMKVVVPIPAIMSAFHEAVGPLTELMLALDLESRTLERVREDLLQKLLSGELRVRDAERMVERAV